MDVEEIGTLEDTIRDLVEGLNEVILGEGDSEVITCLDLASLLQSIYGERTGLDTALRLTDAVLAHATDALVNHVRERYGLFAPLPAGGDLDLDMVGAAMVNMAIADMDMDDTPRNFLRQPVALERLRSMVVFFAVACLDPDVQHEHHEELGDGDGVEQEDIDMGSWSVQAGAILEDPVLRGLYMAALSEHPGPAFEAALKRVITDFADAIDKSMLEMAVEEAALQVELTLRGGSHGAFGLKTPRGRS